MGSTAGLDVPTPPRGDAQTTEDVERAKRALLIRAAAARRGARESRRACRCRATASAGITTVLATPAGDAIRGQSALINTALPPDAPQIGATADDRRGQLVVKSPVALHVTFCATPRRRQRLSGLADGRHRVRPAGVSRTRSISRWRSSTTRRARRAAARPLYDASLDALQPALAGRMPVAFEAENIRGDSARARHGEGLQARSDHHRRPRSRSGRAGSQGRRTRA